MKSGIYKKILESLEKKSKTAAELARDLGLENIYASNVVTTMVRRKKGVKRVDMSGKLVVYGIDVPAPPRNPLILQRYYAPFRALTPADYNPMAGRDLAMSAR